MWESNTNAFAVSIELGISCAGTGVLKVSQYFDNSVKSGACKLNWGCIVISVCRCWLNRLSCACLLPRRLQATSIISLPVRQCSVAPWVFRQLSRNLSETWMFDVPEFVIKIKKKSAVYVLGGFAWKNYTPWYVQSYSTDLVYISTFSTPTLCFHLNYTVMT